MFPVTPQDVRSTDRRTFKAHQTLPMKYPNSILELSSILMAGPRSVGEAAADGLLGP